MKVYVLEQVSRKTNTITLVDIFESPKAARLYFDKFFNLGQSTKKKWKKCPHKQRRYEGHDNFQWFITEFRVRKEKDYG